MKAYNFKRFGQFKTKTFPHGKRCYIRLNFLGVGKMYTIAEIKVTVDEALDVVVMFTL